MNKVIFEKDLSKHPLHYFVLLCLQIIGLWGIFWFSYRPVLQFITIIYMGIGYVTWGIIHHKIHKDLHIKIVLEYILFATILITLFSSLIFRS